MDYTITLPLPGGPRDCRIHLEAASGSLTGTLQNPYNGEACALYDSEVCDGKLCIKAMVGRTEFVLAGSEDDITFTTHETIPLDAGTRIAGKTNELPGEYLVGVYSPGGVRENHFVITKENDILGGEMFGLVDEKALAFMAQMMQGGPSAPMGPDAPGEMPPMPKLGDKSDINPFLSVSGDASDFEITTKTGNGSLFVFQGSISGDQICMTLHVTDENRGLKLVRA